MKLKLKVMNWLKKLIPVYIEVRSLYWVKYEKQMDEALKDIFHQIDIGDYKKSQELIDVFESTFTQNGVPGWVALKYSEVYRATSMLNFLVG
jgi:hypothetical protein